MKEIKSLFNNDLLFLILIILNKPKILIRGITKKYRFIYIKFRASFFTHSTKLIQVFVSHLILKILRYKHETKYSLFVCFFKLKKKEKFN